MKIALVADTHFGLRRFEEDSFAQGERALLSADERADAIILAGDIFDSRVPKPETLARVFEIFRKLGKPVFAIHGTHERRMKGLVNPIQMMAGLELLKDVHGRTEVLEVNGEKLAVSGLGGVPDEYAKSALEALSPKPLEGAFNVFVLHQSIGDIIFTGKELLELEDLPAGFDLYLCGHVHRRGEAMGGKFLIPGSTVITQLRKEEMGEKGYLLYDAKKRNAEFVPIKTRLFFYRELEFSGAHLTEVRKGCAEEIAEVRKKAGGKGGGKAEGREGEGGSEEPIIRVVLKGTLAAGVAPGDVAVGMADGKLVFIDNELNEAVLKEKIEKIRQARERKTSVGELGMGILREKLREKKCGIADADGLFEKLVEGVEEAFENVKRKPAAE